SAPPARVADQKPACSVVGWMVQQCSKSSSNSSDGSRGGQIVRFVHTHLCLLNDVVHHGFHVGGPAIYFQLPVRARTHLHDLADVLHFCPASQFVEHVIHELQVLLNQLALRNFHLLPEVD